MNAFFGEDTVEEDKLIKNILTKKDEKKLPKIIEEITTSHLVKTITKPQKEEVKVKSEGKDKEENNKTKEALQGKIETINLSIADRYTYEEKLNLDFEAHIFPFHVQKNGRINYDMYFIPYKSIDNKDVITQYSYSYDYYDIYSENIEYVNQSIHLNKHKRKLENVNTEKKEEIDRSAKRMKIKEEPTETNVKENVEGNVKETIETNVEKDTEKTTDDKEKEKENIFEKWLVHFRGRLFIGNKINYPQLNINTYLATTKSFVRNYEKEESQSPEESLKEFRRFNKTIETYNEINNATYWKQDEFPGIHDPNIQKLLFFSLVPPINDDTCENELEEEESITF